MTTLLDDLNTFYLGQSTGGAYHLLASKHLTTHGFCVGMTGSGKTGFCLSLLEEAALDGIPALIVDFKGDLCNHFLQFPDLRPESFRPWLDPTLSAAQAEAEAQKVALRWQEGLQASGIQSERIQKLLDSVEFSLYTPGSTLGRPLAITSLFTCPDTALLQDLETANTLISSHVTALLQLIQENTDPLTSKPLILLSNLVGRAWMQGKGLSLTELIQQISHPPIEQLGVLPIEDFYPTRERLQLALRLNSLFASPSFASWMQGDPLDIQTLLFNPQGKPRHTVLHLAHLGEAERMFFLTYLLNTLIAWMRTQSGSSSLRALLFLDEIFGYLPPVANPPSKKPLLTLLKQARAYGLGLLLASQNPVDLDYRALTNCGLWWIGRLSTAQDQARLLDALSQEQADSGLTAESLSSLQPREFWQRSPDSSQPVRFTSRFCMGFLPGPLRGTQLRELTQRIELQTMSPAGSDSHTETESSTLFASTSEDTTAATSPSPSENTPSFANLALEWIPSTPAESNLNHQNSSLPPMLDERIPTAYAHNPQKPAPHYLPYLFGQFQIQYNDRKAGFSTTRNLSYEVPLQSGLLAWSPEQLKESEFSPQSLALAPQPQATYAPLPPDAKKPSFYTRWTRQLQDEIALRSEMRLFYAPQAKEYSLPGETESEFVARLRLSSREALDAKIEPIKARYQKELERLSERIQKARQALEREQQESGQKQRDAWISIGATVLSGLLGGSTARTASKVSTATRSLNRISKQKGDVARADETLQELERKYDERVQACEQEIHDLREQLDRSYVQIEPIGIIPKRTQITPLWMGLLWKSED